MNFDLIPRGIDSLLEDGTVDGQLLFWASKWVHTEATELIWNDTNKRLGIGVAAPAQSLDVKDKIAINNETIAFLPDQTNFTGSLIFGDGGVNIEHTAGVEGHNNIALGLGVFEDLTKGTENIGIGFQALKNITTGNYNISIGQETLKTLTTTNHNTAIGINALTLCSGTQNVSLGNDALKNTGNANRNMAIGNGALLNNTTGSDNVGIGQGAAWQKQTGNENVFIGMNAGSGGAAYNTEKNVIIGKNAGNSIITGALNNILIGWQAGDNITTGHDNIIIGHDLSAPVAAGNNQLNIGGIIRGDLSTGTVTIEGTVGLKEITTPTAEANYGKVYTKNDNKLYFQDGAGNEHLIGGNPFSHNYNLTTQGLGASPDVYVGGYYEAPVAAAVLNQGNLTQTHGTANKCQGGYAFLVAAAAGTAAGGAGAVTIKVTGTSIANDGTRTLADNEVLVADITTLATNDYVETTKRWLGQVTYTIDPGATGHANYALSFNYGFCRYDGSNAVGTIEGFHITGFAGANENDFDIIMYKHSPAGWTYNNGAFVPGGTVICQLSTDCATDDKLVSSEHFHYQRTVSVAIVAGEGYIFKIKTTANNAIEYANITVRLTL